MTATTKPFNQGGSEGGKNGHMTGPPGAFTTALTAAEGVKFITLLNMTQYVQVFNWGVGALRIAWNDTAGNGINGNHAVSTLKACYFEIPPGGVFAQPIECGKMYFKAVADTEFSFGCTFSTEKAPSQLLGADQFDLVEEMDVTVGAARTDFT